MQYSTAVNNARLDAVESTTGVSPTLTLYLGAVPQNCAATDSGALALVTMTLPSDWMAVAANGVKAMAGSWAGTASGGAAATPSFFRIKQGSTCHIQGTAGIGTGECQVNGTITVNQTVSVTSFSIASANT